MDSTCPLVIFAYVLHHPLSLSLAFRVFPLLVFPLCSFTQYKGYTYICSWLLFWCFWGFFGWLGLQWCLLHQAERRHAINTTVARVTIAIRAVAVATAVVAVLRPPYVIWPNRPADRRSQPFMSIKVILLFFRRCSFCCFFRTSLATIVTDNVVVPPHAFSLSLFLSVLSFLGLPLVSRRNSHPPESGTPLALHPIKNRKLFIQTRSRKQS